MVDFVLTRDRLDAAVALAEAGRVEEALPRFEESARALRTAEGWRNVGHALSDLGRPKEAVEAYAQAVRLGTSRSRSFAWAQRSSAPVASFE